MKSKATRGLTKAGKRRGRPPKYLTADEIADPLRAATGSPAKFLSRSGWRSLPQGVPDERLRRLIEHAEQRSEQHTRYEIAFLVLQQLEPLTRAEPEEVEAMAARIRRLHVEPKTP